MSRFLRWFFFFLLFIFYKSIPRTRKTRGVFEHYNNSVMISIKHLKSIYDIRKIAIAVTEMTTKKKEKKIVIVIKMSNVVYFSYDITRSRISYGKF